MPKRVHREQWRSIPGYEGLYEVSSLGRVRSLDRILYTIRGDRRRYKGRVLKPYPISTYRNYLAVALCAWGGEQGRYTVHSLVLSAFRGPRPEGLEARHLNGDSMDNRSTNLVYGTREENVEDRIRHAKVYPRRGDTHHSSKVIQKQVDKMFVLSATKKQIELSQIFNISTSQVSRILNGQRR